MRWRVILGISLVANLILAAMWFRTGRVTSTGPASAEAGTNILSTTNTKTAVIVRRQFFSWQQLESQDYQIYIKNLREIGCPEQTIRDIIIADVTQMLREKYLAVSPRAKPNPKWWTNHREAAEEDLEAQNTARMWVERGTVLEQLLGTDWAVRGRTLPPGNTNGPQNQILATLEVNPVLQTLAPDKKQLLASLLSTSPTIGSGTEDIGTTVNYDAAGTIAAERERWAKLAEVLTVEQLEAAKLHFSLHADGLRNELDALPGFNTQPDEFRKIFRNTEAIEAQLAALASRDDAAATKERATLNSLREAALRSSLAPERYELYARLSDPAYLEAMETAGGGANENSIGLIYALNRERAAEQERIENNASLTDAQREIELKRLELEQLQAIAQALGEDVSDDSQKSKPRPEPMKTHSVLSGESLERIARIYGVPPEALRAANPNLDFSKLPAGANVNIPLRLIYPLPPPSE